MHTAYDGSLFSIITATEFRGFSSLLNLTFKVYVFQSTVIECRCLQRRDGVGVGKEIGN